jgi:hypothetical protein
MKYIVVLLVAGGVYATLVRPAHRPQAPAPAAGAHAQPDASESGSDFLKEPLDRTHEVLDQARNRVKDPALQ